MQKRSIVYKDTSTLIPYVGNSRTHSDDQVKQIAASIQEFGFTNPILIDENNSVIAGHGRMLAAELIGQKEVPCIVLTDLTKAQQKALVIADNQLALNADWDLDKLTLELESLGELDFDIDLLGFDDDFLENLLAPEENAGLTDDDAVPDIHEDPTIVLGDVWILGNHRLMCGDSTSIDAFDRLMDGQKADMVFTSPPYNANTQVGEGDVFRKGVKKKKLYADGFDDNLKSDEYLDFVSSVLENCFLNTDGFIFWNVNYNANSRHEYLKQVLPRVEFIIEQICWRKSSVIPYKGMFKRDWEPIYIFSTNKQGLNLQNVTSNIWDIHNVNSQAENHKACFPVALPEKAIKLVNINTGRVLDPFGGSGTTLIACEKTNRYCCMMELDPIFCDVIIKRWEEFTGQDAVHADTGITYKETCNV